MRRAANIDKQVYKAVLSVCKDLDDNPLGEGEQLNLMGYSYGSVVQAHAALALADKGIKVDNLVLVGSPISSDSELYKALLDNPNIGKVIRYDIPDDTLSDPDGVGDMLQGGWDGLSTDAPHFDLARPDDSSTSDIDEGAEADERIDDLAKYLKDRGLKE